MRKRNFVLIFILLFITIFTFSLVKLTNLNIARTYRRSSENTFYLLSFVVDHYLQHEKELEYIVIEAIQKKSIQIAEKTAEPDESYLSQDIQGIWIFGENTVKGISNYKNIEKEIIRFYEQNLKGKNFHTLIIIENRPFYLVNTLFDSREILLLCQGRGISGAHINQLLDSLVISSNLIYFAILDKDQTPILFSSLYDNFLPLQGEGMHTIKTPKSTIFQIEKEISGKNFVAGFAMGSLQRIKFANNLFLIFIIIAFVILETVLLYNFIKFEKFKDKKEKEVNLFKEIGALSTGFAHEFRNSLHTLSLLARDMNKEQKCILNEEIARMRSVMDLLKSISTTKIEKKEIVISDIINESISLLHNMIMEKNVNLQKNIDEKIEISGNRTLLITALSNLMKNCIEADAKNVFINAVQKGNILNIEVVDDGSGINSKIIGNIFEPFFSNKNQSGLGLYLVKKIIEVHGGEIKVESNKKTIFKISLLIK